jgi:hypothetical protein
VKKALLGAVFSLSLFAMLPDVRAEGVFPLRYQQLTDRSQPCAAVACRYFTLLPPPEQPQALPAGIAGAARPYSTQFGSGQLLLVLAGSKAYLDTDADGDLSGEAPLVQVEMRSQGNVTVYQFAPVAVRIPGSQEGVRTAVSLEVTSMRGREPDAAFYPAGCCGGMVQFGRSRCRLAVVDGDYDGRYDGVFSPSSDGAAHDWLAVDLNGDGRMDRGADGVGEVIPLPKLIQMDGAYYGLEVQPDGSAIRITKAEPKVGVLDVGTPGAEVALLSDCGAYRLGGAEGKWLLPEGDYVSTAVNLNLTDRRAAKWTLRGTGNVGGLRHFRIRVGETLVQKVGPPLTGKTTVTQLSREPATGQSIVMIGCEVTGQAGEAYLPGVEKDGQRQPPPRFRVLDQRGKVNASGLFEYG